MSATKTLREGSVDSLREARSANVLIGADDHAFLVPAEAVTETVYPLFGVQHATIDVPRQACWEQLKVWMAVEQKVRGGSLSQAWKRTIAKKPSFFQHCAVVSLARPSRSLPAGDLVFECLSDFVAIPEGELASLSPHDQTRVREACTRAMFDFPDGRPLVLLRPVYVGEDRARRLASPRDVLAAAKSRRDLLFQFCRDHGRRVPLERSEDHLAEAQAERARAVEIVRRQISQVVYEQKLASARLLNLASDLEVEKNAINRSKLRQAAFKEAISLVEFGRRLGLPLADPDILLAQFRLFLIDPVIVIEEPRWRLPCYGQEISLLRAAVHWDDAGVTMLA